VIRVLTFSSLTKIFLKWEKESEKMASYKDETGHVYGKWTVLRKAD